MIQLIVTLEFFAIVLLALLLLGQAGAMKKIAKMLAIVIKQNEIQTDINNSLVEIMRCNAKLADIENQKLEMRIKNGPSGMA